jgi:hypothetical protein
MGCRPGPVRLIIGGDFNARYDHSDIGTVKIGISDETRIDHIFANKSEGFFDIKINDVGGPQSDHNPISFKLLLRSPICIRSGDDRPFPRLCYRHNKYGHAEP